MKHYTHLTTTFIIDDPVVKNKQKRQKKKKKIKSRVVKLNEFTIDSHSSLFSAFSCTDSTTRR